MRAPPLVLVALLVAAGCGSAAGPAGRSARQPPVPGASTTAAAGGAVSAAPGGATSEPAAFNTDACARVVRCCPQFLRSLGRGVDAPRACPLIQYFLRQFPDEAESCPERLAEMRQSLGQAGRPVPAACTAP